MMQNTDKKTDHNIKPPFKWKRHAIIIDPMETGSGWTAHRQMPTPIMLDKDRIRVYYTSRSSKNQAHILYVDISSKPPYQILERPQKACLAPGPLGHFDAAGVMPTAVTRVEDEIRLYYIGWTVRQDVPYHNSIGIAVSKDGGNTFTRLFDGPIIGTSKIDPLFCSTADVARWGEGWIMWYASTTQWIEMDRSLEPRYHLRVATSVDGLDWEPTGKIAVDYRNDSEAAVARATVMQEQDGFHMWFCSRDIENYRESSDAAYRLEYATSSDGLNWHRSAKDTNVLTGQFEQQMEFDNVMQAYPAVLETATGPILFFNGNGFGQTGIAVALPNETKSNNA